MKANCNAQRWKVTCARCKLRWQTRNAPQVGKIFFGRRPPVVRYNSTFENPARPIRCMSGAAGPAAANQGAAAAVTEGPAATLADCAALEGGAQTLRRRDGAAAAAETAAALSAPAAGRRRGLRGTHHLVFAIWLFRPSEDNLASERANGRASERAHTHTHSQTHAHRELLFGATHPADEGKRGEFRPVPPNTLDTIRRRTTWHPKSSLIRPAARQFQQGSQQVRPKTSTNNNQSRRDQRNSSNHNNRLGDCREAATIANSSELTTGESERARETTRTLQQQQQQQQQ